MANILHSSFRQSAGWHTCLFTAALVSVCSPASQAFELVAGAPQTEALVTPFSVDFDGEGNIYGVEFENGHRVFKLDVRGKFSFLGGQKGVMAPKDENGKGDGGPIANALFSGMHDLSVTRAGYVYIADSWVGRIRLYTPENGQVKTVAGTGKKGDSGDGGPAVQADINQTFACALSPDDKKLYVVDIASRRVRVLELDSGLIHAFAGNGKKGAPHEDGVAKEQPLINPRAVAVDPRNGLVYIVDRDAHSLQVVENGKIRTVVNKAGKKGATGDGGPGLEATLNGPKHACVDPQGRVIIADAENHVIRRYDPETKKIELLAGTPARKGDELTAGSVLLNRPHGVRVSRDGKWLYIVDSYNNRVLRTAYK